MSARQAAQVTLTIGILDFVDDSAAGIPALGSGVARLVRQRLSAGYREAVTKAVSPGAGAAEGPPPIEQLRALGQRYGVKYVVHGGVLPLEVGPPDHPTTVTVSLYADVVTLETGGTQTVRVDGSAASDTTSATLDTTADIASALFAATPVGRALNEAVGRLADAIHQVITTPQGGTPPPPEAAAPTPESPVLASGATATAQDLDAEIQQLVADAQNAIVNYGGIAPDQANRLQADMEQLNGILSQKADLLSRGEDTQAADQALVKQRDVARASLDALVQAAMGAQSAQPSGESLAPPSEGVMSRANTFAGETISLVQKIQELRALLFGASEEAEAAGLTGDPGAEAAVEQDPGSVTGVVVEDGQPVEGAEVTETTTGATTTTGPDGSYTLAPLPPGLRGVLQVKRHGKLLASGLVHIAPLRVALADFPVAKSTSGTMRPAILGSTSIRRSARNAGSISGRVLDGAGKPMARALVAVPGAGVVRTNSSGQFMITGATAGGYNVSARDAGGSTATAAVKVMPGSTPAILTLRLGAPPRAQVAASALKLQPTDRRGAALSGRIRDQKDHDLAGVRISLLHGQGALSVLTNGSGRYALRGIDPGEYRVIVARPGFQTETRSVGLKAGDDKKVELKLKQLTAMVDTMRRVEAARRAAPASAARREVRLTPTPPPTGKTVAVPAPGTAATMPRVAPPATIRVERGHVQGRVVDAQTHKPVAGARVSVAGGPGAVTDRNGGFRIQNLTPGAVHIGVSRPGYVGQERSVSIRTGGTASVEFTLRAIPRPRR